MKYSDKLNGFWEEGYHYYIEIRKNRMTVLDYHRRPMLETMISYDAKAIECRGLAEITLDDNILSRTAYGEPMTMIRKLTFIDGRLELLYYYTIMGETLYILNKVDRGPFDYLTILDNTMLKKLSGTWVQSGTGDRRLNRPLGTGDMYPSRLEFSGNRMKYFSSGYLALDAKIHICEIKTTPGSMFITPEDLSERDFGMISEIMIEGNTLTTRMHICDADSPMMVFMREEDIDADDRSKGDTE